MQALEHKIVKELEAGTMDLITLLSHSVKFGIDLALLVHKFPGQFLKLVELHFKSKDGEDDRQGGLELTMRILSTAPANEATKGIVQKLLNLLWHSIEKPYKLADGKEIPRVPCVPSLYRTSEAYFYSSQNPTLGAVGSRYAKSFASTHEPTNLPESGNVFDQLLWRKEFTPHPNSINELLFDLAALITHDLFWTNHDDITQNLASSYLDLAPLYGRTSDITNSVRTFENGRLQLDAIGDERVLLQIPGVLALLVCFNRNHNWIINQLLKCDESMRFLAITNLKIRDELLFNTARIINCLCYVNLILNDYVRTILDVPPTSTFTLDPRDLVIEESKVDGNLVSIEFNFLYRWHPCLSQEGEAWINKALVPTLIDFVKKNPGIRPTFKDMFPAEVRDQVDTLRYANWRPELGAKTDGDKSLGYSTTALKSILEMAIKSHAGKFGARNTPLVFKKFEIQAIDQGRVLKVCTLNEFRKGLHLKPYSSFSDMTNIPGDAEILQKLYGTVDNVELYVGLTTEATKDSIGDRGLATNFTTSRAILSDAVNLVRNDRYFNKFNTPEHITQWGFDLVRGIFTDPFHEDFSPMRQPKSLAALILQHGGVTDGGLLGNPFRVPK